MRPDSWEESPSSLVRPYIGGPSNETDTPLGRAGDDYFPRPPMPATADFGGLLGSAGPGNLSNRPNQVGRPNEHTTPLLVGQPTASRPSRHTKAPQQKFAANGARRWSLAIVSVAGAAVAAVFFLAAQSSPKGAPGATCPSSTGCGATHATVPKSAVPSLADGGYGSMSAPASHTAASASPTASRTAKPISSPLIMSSPVPSPASGSLSLSPGSLISIEATSACCRTFSIAHDSGDNQVVIAQVTAGSSLAARANATWTVVHGLADSSCISFESADAPGEYLRHRHFVLFLDPDDGSAGFARDATFCLQPGNSGQGYSFESYNDPFMFIRHFDFVVFIASKGGQFPWDASAHWHHDTTWTIIQPWA